MAKRSAKTAYDFGNDDVSDGYYALVALVAAILMSTVATIVGVGLAMMA